ncbi:hypothetical protein UPYG_G00160740 [Umbra pygmaea]|uniref:Uncharacterized protein n=1 Tax=Umbra pygmaea TaxID=75934 RepID=A0ABD0XH74_UMBPY
MRRNTLEISWYETRKSVISNFCACVALEAWKEKSGTSRLDHEDVSDNLGAGETSSIAIHWNNPLRGVKW